MRNLVPKKMHPVLEDFESSAMSDSKNVEMKLVRLASQKLIAVKN